MPSLHEVILHCQKKLKKETREERLLHYLGRLAKLHITVSDLAETGIGRTVNQLGRHNGKVGHNARKLVKTWKAIVAEHMSDDSESESAASQDDEDEEEDKCKDEPQIKEEKEPINVGITRDNIKTEPQSSDDEGNDEHHIDANSDSDTSDRLCIADVNNTSVKQSRLSDSEDDPEVVVKIERNPPSPVRQKAIKIKQEHENHKSSHKHHNNHSSSETEIEAPVKIKREPGEEASSSQSSREKETSRHRKREDKHKHESRKSHKHKKDKHRDRSKDRSDRKHKEKRSRDRDRERSSSKTHESESSAKKPRLEKINDVKSSNSTCDSKKKIVINGEIDSTSGVNFSEVLGALDTSKTGAAKSKKCDKKDRGDHKSKSSKEEKRSSSSNHVDLHEKYKDLSSRPSSSFSLGAPTPAIKISPNYKPVFKKSLPLSLDSNELNGGYWEDSRLALSQPCKMSASRLDEEDTLASMMSSRVARTKVYSGNRSGIKGQVPKLFDLCMQVIQANIHELGDTGGVPYDILKPALERATVKQLLAVENVNDYLIDDTDELWQFHCKRDFRGQEPREGESWRDLYLRSLKCREDKLQQFQSKMKKNLKEADPVRKAKLAIVEMNGGPRFNKKKAQTIKNGIATLKFREEKGAKGNLSSSASVGFNNPSGDPSTSNSRIEHAAVTIRADTKAAHAPAPPASREPAAAKQKPRKAPLMQKTMKLIKTMYRR